MIEGDSTSQVRVEVSGMMERDSASQVEGNCDRHDGEGYITDEFFTHAVIQWLKTVNKSFLVQTDLFT